MYVKAMTEPIRLLHFADAHIGVENYGRLDSATGISSRVLDFLHRLDEVIDYARAHAVDIAVFAGDAFQSRNPTPTYQREFAWRVCDLAAMCPVVLLVGNHDQPAMIEKAASTEVYDTLDVPNVTLGKEYAVHRIETRRGPVQVATAPYPNRTRLLKGKALSGLSIAEVDALLEEELRHLITKELAQDVSQSDAPRVLTGHFTVSGATVGSERKIMLGRDAAVLLSALADPVWDYVALGHVHKHQNMTEGRAGAPPVVYAGSLERVDFGEEGDPKGFCWVELARGATTWEFVPVNARPFLTIRVDVRRSEDPTADVLARIARENLEGAVVRLILRTTPENAARLHEGEIRTALRAAHHVASIQKDVERSARARLGGTSPEELTPRELLERYLAAKGTPDERAEVLLEHADKLFALE
jgi:exonuclease SbcD